MELGDLQAVFQGFAGGATELDGKSFAKLSKDCALLDKKLTATDIDLIFAKVKDKSARKITFQQFIDALDHMATKKGISKEDLAAKIVATGGPKFTGTKAEAVKFYDDKSTFTGVHANGGPSTIDAHGGGLANLLDRSPADVRGRKM
uniref:EF-hand domain-containing protein n=1 Tax=Chromera velia CCMP2878 TaxID=1169474 RepID=A0A0G4HN69_9ALVE|eukprot:Cvel_29348.t1-p1 / transcript=Cvel_29348.t1 / gene=Cvel_29348 / organism=Chromera_velia_CCMP2878 / gene_product=Tubulin polymerization-promoting protein family, putative / transcript_product=Tubulin polymerization-promoting protein family, putative / location=Cvel_scaffold3994:2339-2776(-) / protein_length=146 / sequence_SO=supercontig / SO=protein_coding / is_pseudo=false